MCSDAVQEGCGLWFLVVEESQAELPYTRYGVGVKPQPDLML